MIIISAQLLVKSDFLSLWTLSYCLLDILAVLVVCLSEELSLKLDFVLLDMLIDESFFIFGVTRMRGYGRPE